MGSFRRQQFFRRDHGQPGNPYHRHGRITRRTQCDVGGQQYQYGCWNERRAQSLDDHTDHHRFAQRYHFRPRQWNQHGKNHQRQPTPHGQPDPRRHLCGHDHRHWRSDLGRRQYQCADSFRGESLYRHHDRQSRHSPCQRLDCQRLRRDRWRGNRSGHPHPLRDWHRRRCGHACQRRRRRGRYDQSWLCWLRRLTHRRFGYLQ